jgi:DEAD/DEAH box helicase domain-containing protein
MFIEEALHAVGGNVTESVKLPGAPPSYGAVPELLEPRVARQLAERFPHGLYAHQAKAIQLACEGKSICIATPTASGKTLVFTSYAVSHLLQSAGSVVLALYPARALIQDQLKRWQEAVAGLDLRVCIIDGGTPMHERTGLLSTCRIVLMTPDVMHAWLMAHLGEAAVRQFVGALELVILDEAHVYDGVFGTNMAYLLRRLRASSGVGQFLAGSATVGQPADLLQRLTGLNFTALGAEDDGAGRADKEVLLCSLSPRRASLLIRQLAAAYEGRPGARFLVFADSRKRVEEIAAEQRSEAASAALPEGEAPPATDAGDEIEAEELVQPRLLPYRAGYEEEDRHQIQTALANGTLIGVVTTSALELGIDIGEIELAVLLGAPPSVKSFWQRAGRAGRQKPGFVALVDLDQRVSTVGLGAYLARPPEPNWLYLDNEYLQYANALCAAAEIQEGIADLYSRAPYSNLPSAFSVLLDNELQPTRPIPPDLYPLKQQAQMGPHRAFPVRTGIEKSYSVLCKQLPGVRLGTMTYQQLLREAFPGAIYRYLARPYRVVELKHYNSEVITLKANGIGRTTPVVQTAVFPQLGGPIYHLKRSDSAWIAECNLQVSERVIGFVEKWGNKATEHTYAAGSHYAQKPLNRYVDTTGVCFFFPDEELQRDALGKYVALAFCRICSVQDRDIGSGTFVSQVSPWNAGGVRGFAVYDSAFGSLRLTKQIPDKLAEILDEAARLAGEEGASRIAAGLRSIHDALSSMTAEPTGTSSIIGILGPDTSGEWLTVIAPDQPAILHDGQAHQNEEVTILRYVYTPQGIRYTLKAPRVGVDWSVLGSMVRPVPGMTKLEEYNVNTGETRQQGSHA